MAGSQDFAPDPRNETVLALVDGALVPAASAMVSIFDAGFGLGDGVWEGLRLHNRALLFLDAHLDRLYSGARAIAIDIGLSREALTDALRDLLRANAMTDGAHLRLMVTRGRKRSINQDPRQALGRATIVCTAEFKRSVASHGLRLRSVTTRTSGPDIFDMRLNSHSRLNYICALLEAIRIDPQADEALMCDPAGNVASCNATNFFWAKGGVLHTSGDLFCFNGITRANVIGLCRDGLLRLEQGDFPPGLVADADEAFTTGTMGGITPVREIDGRTLPQVNGPVTRRVADAYAELKDADAAANPLV